MLKQTFLFGILLFFSTQTSAQLETPSASPLSNIEQRVGLTDLSVRYSRPSRNNRKIFGELLPYGTMWRTGANKATVVSFSTKVSIQGKEIPAGPYAILTIPYAEEWEIIFYPSTDFSGIPKDFSDDKVVHRFKVNTTTTKEIEEVFTIALKPVSFDECALTFTWETTQLSVAIKLPTEELTEKEISKALENPNSTVYYRAAAYYLERGKNLEQALEWMKLASATMENIPFWFLQRQALIEQKIGYTSAALATAQKALLAAIASGNEQYTQSIQQLINTLK